MPVIRLDMIDICKYYDLMYANALLCINSRWWHFYFAISSAFCTEYLILTQHKHTHTPRRVWCSLTILQWMNWSELVKALWAEREVQRDSEALLSRLTLHTIYAHSTATFPVSPFRDIHGNGAMFSLSHTHTNKVCILGTKIDTRPQIKAAIREIRGRDLNPGTLYHNLL